jgi:hypothetical protein
MAMATLCRQRSMSNRWHACIVDQWPNQMCKGRSAAPQRNLALQHSNGTVASRYDGINTSCGDRAAGTPGDSGPPPPTNSGPPPPTNSGPPPPPSGWPAPALAPAPVSFAGMDEEVSGWLQQQIANGVPVDQAAMDACGPQWSNKPFAGAGSQAMA